MEKLNLKIRTSFCRGFVGTLNEIIIRSAHLQEKEREQERKKGGREKYRRK